jgi:shikimate dehydrogenase
LKRAFLIGKGISNSLSPIIQNAAFRKMGIDATYELEDLNRRSLKSFISSLKLTDTIGFNVTSPFKEEIMRYLTTIDSRSENIGAVNTVKISNGGRMAGLNTDYDGIVSTLRTLGSLRGSAKQRKAIILGAGGAARASVYVLLKNGYSKLTIMNRTVAKAKELSNQFESSFHNSNINVVPLTKTEFVKSVQDSGLIINAISGSNSKFYPLKLDFSGAATETAIFDLGYKEDSLFLKTARKNGLKTVNGLLMLVTQAAKSFEIWTGRKAPFKLMMSTAKRETRCSV